MEDVLALLENYRSTWEGIVRETGNVDEVNQFFHLPCFFIGADGSVLLFKVPEDISEFHRPRLKSFQEGGVKKPRAENVKVAPLGPNNALIGVTWEQYREDDTLERAWQHSYHAIKTDLGWRFLVSTFQAGA
jgi:hypothetical protein